MNKSKGLNNRYILLQGSYYAVSVCFTGFMVPVLQKQGFNNSQIGILLGIRALLSVLAQPFFADYFQKTKRNFTLNHLIAGLIVMSMIMTGYSCLILILSERLSYLWRMVFLHLVLFHLLTPCPPFISMKENPLIIPLLGVWVL